MIKWNNILLKAILYYAFFSYETYNCLLTGIDDIGIILDENTIGKYTIYIFFAFLTIILDNNFLNKCHNIFYIVRYGTRIKMALKTFEDIFITQLLNILVVFVCLYPLLKIYRIKVSLEPKLILNFLILFLYLTVLCFIMLLTMCISLKRTYAMFSGCIINFIFMIIGQNYFSIVEYKYIYILLLLLVTTVLIIVCIHVINTKDNYSFVTNMKGRDL